MAEILYRRVLRHIIAVKPVSGIAWLTCAYHTGAKKLWTVWEVSEGIRQYQGMRRV